MKPTNFLPGPTAGLLLLVLVGFLACGCANRYKVTLTNSNEITTRNKPRLNEDQTAYKFKDSQGREVVLPAFRIREIEPL